MTEKRYKITLAVILAIVSTILLLVLARNSVYSFLTADLPSSQICTPYPTPLCQPNPEGSRIVFSSNRACSSGVWPHIPIASANYDIYVMNSDGTCATQITNISSNARRPRWSPDGTHILFEIDRLKDGKSSILYVMNTDGSGMRQLADSGSYDCKLGALWSPNGSQIAFISGKKRTDCLLYVVDINGTQKRVIEDLALRGPYGGFGWSPDGTHIAFSAYNPSTEKSDVYTVNVDGTGLTDLTEHPADDIFLAWTSNGSQILFVSDRDMYNTEVWEGILYIMDADGRNVRRLVDDIRYDLDQGIWVPSLDSTIIIRLIKEWPSPSEWHVVDIECILSSSTEPGILPEECHYKLLDPRAYGTMVYSNWPPGGLQFSYNVLIPDPVNPDMGTSDIFVVNFDGTGLTNLTNYPADDIDPDWSP